MFDSSSGRVKDRSAPGDAPKEVKVRHIGNCLKADPAYGAGVAKALGIPLSEVPKK
jgi:catalase